MLRNVPIRRKLLIILAVPLLVLTVVAVAGILGNLGQSTRARQGAQAATLSGDATVLIHELQRERNLSQAFVASGRRTGGDQLGQQRQTTNVAHDRLARTMEQVEASGDAPARLTNLLGPLRNELARLAEQRRSIDTGRQAGVRQQPAPADARQSADAADPSQPAAVRTPGEALDQYDATIQGLLGLAAQAGVDAADAQVTRAAAASQALSQYKEALAREWGMVTELSAGNAQLDTAARERLIALVTERDTWLAEFRRTASEDQLDSFEETAGVDRIRQHEDQALAARPAQLGAERLTQWVTDAEAQFTRLQTLEADLAGEVTALGQRAESASSRGTVGYGALLALVALTAVALWLLSRSLVGPLARLRDAANQIAERQLPEQITRLQRSEGIPPAPEIQPIPVHARDEVGQVTEAFNAVHRVALEAATEQAMMRRGVSEMFLNLARRNQALVDRQIELIDELERNESDPEALEELFRLDHLATRMRRTAEDLIVLSGAKPARRWSQPVPLADTIRAAIAEVEDYTRVELLPIEDLGVTGQAVADVVHLLAELIENATAFSPPGTKVHVAGQTVSNGYVIEIEDRGIGMSDSELVAANERLANPLSTDLSVSQRLGLFVVARLAGRYGIKVQLRHSWYDGITALVFLPESLIVDSRALQLESTGQTNGNGFQAIVPELGASMATITTKNDLPPGHPENIENPFEGESGAPSGDLPGRTGELPRLGEAARTGEFPRFTDEFPRVTDEPAGGGVVEAPRPSAEFPRVTGEFPRTTGEFQLSPDQAPGPGDRLPIFEATRSDWFEQGPPDTYSVLRRRREQQGPPAPAADSPTARGATPAPPAPPAPTEEPGRPQDAPPASEPEPTAGSGPGTGIGDAAPPAAPPGPSRTSPLPPRAPGGLPRRQPGSGLPMRNPGDSLPGAGTTRPSDRRQTPTGLPMRRPGAARPPGSPLPPGPGQPPGPAIPTPGGPAGVGGPLPTRGSRNGPAPRTDAGLPRRVPQANRPAAAAAIPPVPAAPAPGAPAGRPNRSPDDIRSMLSRYRTGFERGRHEATSGPDRRPEDRQPPVTERHRDAAAAPRSDDDAVE